MVRRRRRRGPDLWPDPGHSGTSYTSVKSTSSQQGHDGCRRMQQSDTRAVQSMSLVPKPTVVNSPQQRDLDKTINIDCSVPPPADSRSQSKRLDGFKSTSEVQSPTKADTVAFDRSGFVASFMRGQEAQVTKLEELWTDIIRLKKENDSLASAAMASNKQIAAMESTNCGLSETIRSIEAQCSSLKEEIEQAKSHGTQVEAELQREHSTAEHLKNERDTLQSTCAKLNTDKAKVEHDIVAERNRYEILKAKSSELEKQLLSISAAAKPSTADLENKLAALTEESKVLRDEIKSHQIFRRGIKQALEKLFADCFTPLDARIQSWTRDIYTIAGLAQSNALHAREELQKALHRPKPNETISTNPQTTSENVHGRHRKQHSLSRTTMRHRHPRKSARCSVGDSPPDIDQDWPAHTPEDTPCRVNVDVGVEIETQIRPSQAEHGSRRRRRGRHAEQEENTLDRRWGLLGSVSSMMLPLVDDVAGRG